MPPRLFIAPSARARLDAARRVLLGLPPASNVIIVGASRAAADELAIAVALDTGASFGVSRVGYTELVTRLALPVLASEGVSPSGALGGEALAARAAFEAAAAGRLSYFGPVAALPGFPRAVARTRAELRLAGVAAGTLADVGESGPDLGELIERIDEQARKAGAVDRPHLLAAAAAVLRDGNSTLAGTTVLLLDVPIASEADRLFLRELTKVAGAITATVPVGDERTLEGLASLGFETVSEAYDPALRGGPPESALIRLQRCVFSPDVPFAGGPDESVVLFSAPGEGRECVEIARRVMEEAARGLPFDEMAVLLRAPQTYLGLLEHAFARAGIPAWFERGTRRPDPAGRAFLALLACADEDLSARRFAEYLSLGQVPAEGEATTTWSPPVEEFSESVVPEGERVEDPEPEAEARRAAEDGERDGRLAGTLRAPWRWEELLVESAVIGHRDRWERRLNGLGAEYRRKLDELRSDEPESPRIVAIERDLEQLDHLRAFALPLVAEMADWPRPGFAPASARSRSRASFGEVAARGCHWKDWLGALEALAPRVLREPARVLRVLQELGPLAGVGPVSLGEVREVLTPRLLMLAREPPRRREGRVFVGTPQAARGRAFRVVFVPGLAERVFPQRLREDPLLLDERRVEMGQPLVIQKHRADEERLQLRLAIGAATERVHVSWPRLELQESRPRVPSFYVLDIARAIEGQIPRYATLRDRASAAGGTTLAWPAPADPDRAIDELEHDLAMLFGLLHVKDRSRAKGRARYLYELSPHLQRSLTGRWARFQKRWHTADGLIRTTPATRPALARQRLTARPYSLSALQRFAECPYQFQLAAMYRLAPLEPPAPLQQLDPLTRGSLFHEIQAELLLALEKNDLLPVTAERLEAARKMLAWAIGAVERRERDTLAPAIDRVWRDEMIALARDLRGWLDMLVEDGKAWRPERFEFAFGLPGDVDRDARSVAEPAVVGGRFFLRGSIDLVERRLDGSSLRVTDHKTGRNRTSMATTVDGGRVLQPLLYGLAMEAITSERVEEGRLSFCTSAGGFSVHPISLNEPNRRRAVEVLEVVDRAIEHGTLAACPAEGACARCDFTIVCGREEEWRTGRKAAGLFADLEELRRMP